MARRTVKRRPFNVDVNVDENKEYFSHTNWKGLYNSQNHFAVDQETFEDCKNVFMDSEGVLKSRPGLKMMSANGLSSIERCWTFSNVTVYLTSDGYLHFVQDKTIEQSRSTGTAVNLTMLDNRIFVFTENSLSYYDLTNRAYYSAEHLIYVPITKIITNGVEVDNEHENVLTNREIYRYLYGMVDGEFSNLFAQDLIGEDVTITIGDAVYNITFAADTLTNLLVKHCEMPAGNVRFSLVDTFICSELTDAENGIYTIYYSADKITFKTYTSPAGTLQAPEISDEGDVMLIVLATGLYVKSLYGSLFSDWTDIFAYHNPDFAYNMTFTNGQRHAVHAVNSSLFVMMVSRLGTYSDSFEWNDFSTSLVRYKFADDVITVTNCNVNSNTGYLNYRTFKYSDGTVSEGSQQIWTALDGDGIFVNTARCTRKRDAFSGIVTNGLKRFHCSFIFEPNSDEQYVFTVSNSRISEKYDGSMDVFDNMFTDTDLDLKSQLSLSENGTYVDVWYSSHEGSHAIIQSIFIKADTDNQYEFNTELTSEMVRGMRIGLNYDDNTILFNGVLYSNGAVVYDYRDTYSGNIDGINVKNKEVIITDYSGRKYLYSNDFSNTMAYIDYEKGYGYNFKLPSAIAKLQTLYFSVGHDLYITSNRYNDVENLMLYVPDVNVEDFDADIVALHPISTNEMGVFTLDALYFVQSTESGYTKTKSKINVKCKSDIDVINSYNGQYIIFPCDRGLMSLSYQQYIASTEQSATAISDPIYKRFEEFNKGSVKLYNYKWWIICYRQDKTDGYLYDMRNGSFWYIDVPFNVQQVIEIDDELLVLGNGQLHNLKYTDPYSDDGQIIDWYFKSQKLVLNSLNVRKHIDGIVINSINDDSVSNSFKLTITNYRRRPYTTDDETLEYEVNVIGTLVKRLNYFKVNQFQYTIKQDAVNAIQKPISINSILIKYKFTNEVR